MKSSTFLILAGALAISAGAWLHTGTVSAQTAVPAGWAGAYSTAQAQRGAPLYTEMCAGCHGAALAGDALAPALTGPAFLGRWQSKPLSDLQETLHNTMPQNSPGGMSRQQSADVLAFVLSKSGAAAGSKEIEPGGDAAKAAATATSSGPAVPPGFYTEAQARRGHVLFGKVCTPCHTATPDYPAAKLVGRGFSLGSQKIFIDLGGRALQKYPSVYHVYRRIRDSMPSYDANSVSPLDKVDIMAYLLKANGFPAGDTPLPADTTAMKVLKTGAAERGFVQVFNGQDFTGIGFLLGPNCRPAPVGCGRTGPSGVFTIADGTLATTGKIQGYWYPNQKYKNFTLRFDYKFDRPADLDPGDEFYEGNSGYLLFITEHRVWPKGIEVQGNSNNMLNSFGMDAKVVAKDFPDARKRAFRPIGSWSSVEIVSKDGEVKCYENGELLSHITQHEFTEAGYIAFQSEGVPIRWRNIRIKPE